MKLSQFVTPLILGFLLLSSGTFAQKKKRVLNEKRKIDVIIEVNGELVKGEMPELHLELNNNTTPKIQTQYLPGHLIISANDFARLDTAKEFKLCFDNYSYKSGKLLSPNSKLNWSTHCYLSRTLLFHAMILTTKIISAGTKANQTKNTPLISAIRVVVF